MFFFNSQDIFTSFPLYLGLFCSFITAKGVVRIFKVIKCIENDKNSKYNIMYYEMSEQKFKLEDLTKQVNELTEKLNSALAQTVDNEDERAAIEHIVSTIENVCNDNCDNNDNNDNNDNCENNDNCDNNANLIEETNNANNANSNVDVDYEHIVAASDKPRSLNTLWGLL
jgi:hypothetical protein